MHKFKLCNVDTDSISFCKNDGSAFSEEEQIQLLEEINSLMPERIKYEHDGYFKRIIILKAKNYILDDGKKVKIKGSSLKDTKRSPALRAMIKEIVDDLLHDKGLLLEIYHKYIKEAKDIKDISRWVSKKSITESVLNPKRLNEQKVLDALQGTEYQQGDKRYFFYKEDMSLCLVEKFDGDYSKSKLYENIYNTIYIFESIINIDVFPNYKLKKNQELLENI